MVICAIQVSSGVSVAIVTLDAWDVLTVLDSRNHCSKLSGNWSILSGRTVEKKNAFANGQATPHDQPRIYPAGMATDGTGDTHISQYTNKCIYIPIYTTSCIYIYHNILICTYTYVFIWS
jgi:hypothetical protein